MGKMKFIVAIVAFFVAASFPLWINIFGGSSIPPTPEVNASTSGTQCVESREWMRKHHMQLLDHWRNSVVRDRQPIYKSQTTGKEFKISLQKTCMKCHDNKEQFCDKCHEAAGVSVYCWRCHLEPKLAKNGEGAAVQPMPVGGVHEEMSHEVQ